MAGKVLAGWGIAFCLLCAGLIWQWQAKVVVTPLDQPNWSVLSTEQKTILAPLAAEWEAMESFRRKKWLGIAQRYPGMSPEEQASVQRNMKEWARLAPAERKAAREKFKALQQYPVEERLAVKQKWDEYSTLSQEKRDRLKKEAAQRPPPKTPTQPAVAGFVASPATTTRTTSQAALPTAPAASPSRSPLSPLKSPRSPLVVPQTTASQAPPDAATSTSASLPCAEE
ncbi:MAG: DUF3106 domain-containing protein [Rhodocyclaceae bacterium]|jgi:hypothetical protein|nr:DUF3106 domain-containing protein [Rhodocyclaceae bacterium]